MLVMNSSEANCRCIHFIATDKLKRTEEMRPKMILILVSNELSAFLR